MSAIAAALSDSRLAHRDSRRRELELLLLSAFAAVPLYATQTIGPLPLVVFHLMIGAIALNVVVGRGAEVVPPPIMLGVAVAYIPFYIIDAAAISRSAIAASTHLVLFIAAYQPIESAGERKTGQRLLTASLLFTASVATATHIAIVPFVAVFGFLLLRQLMHLSHEDSERMTGKVTPEPRANRAAAFYVCAATAAGILFFPLLPRIRNPVLPGISTPLSSSTGLSDTIDLNDPRSITNDSAVVSRVWMGQDAVPFFTPLRLRGVVYPQFARNIWVQGSRDFLPLDSRDGATRTAVPEGFTRHASVQQRFILGSRLLLPVGTYEVRGAGRIAEGPTRDVFTAWESHRDTISYDIRIARETRPMRKPKVMLSNYPVTPAVRAMAQQIVGNETDPMRQAAAIERYLSTRFRYVPDPAQIGHTMTVDQFLLKEQRGHCEYFAAGMVALMTSLGVPARIVGGFYGGQLNPLTGYFVVRRSDAHAWTEVWDGSRWQTFDSTPAALRPGSAHDGLLHAYANAVSDSINYFWDRYILTFGFADQIALAVEVINRGRAMLGSLNNGVRASLSEVFSRDYAVAMSAFLVAAAAALLLARRRRSPFELLATHLARLGIAIGPSMTMEEALVHLRDSHPDAALDLEPLIALYEEERFSPRPDRTRLAQIRRRLAEM